MGLVFLLKAIRWAITEVKKNVTKGLTSLREQYHRVTSSFRKLEKGNRSSSTAINSSSTTAKHPHPGCRNAEQNSQQAWFPTTTTQLTHPRTMMPLRRRLRCRADVTVNPTTTLTAKSGDVNAAALLTYTIISRNRRPRRDPVRAVNCTAHRPSSPWIPRNVVRCVCVKRHNPALDPTFELLRLVNLQDFSSILWMEEDPFGLPTHPNNVQDTAPIQSPRPDPVMTTAEPPDSSLVTTIPTHDRGASAGPSQRKSPPHPREPPLVTETWHPRDSGRENLPRNSSPSPTRKPSPVSRARRRDHGDRPPTSRQSSPAHRTSHRHRDADQGTPSRQPSPASRSSSRHRCFVQGSHVSPTSARGQRRRHDFDDRSSPSSQDDDDPCPSSGSQPTPELS